MLLPSVVVLECLTSTWPVPVPRGDEGEDLRTDLELLTGRRQPPVVNVIVPWAWVEPVPIGSINPEKPSPPRPICHCTPPVGWPENIAELGPLS